MSFAPVIVVLSDFTEHSDSAIVRSLRLAKDLNCKLHVLHVEEEVAAPFFSVVEPLRRQRTEAAEKVLRAKAEAIGVDIQVATRSGAIFSETILYAQDLNAQLIVVAKDAYRQSTRRTLPINDTVHKLARHADRPVLIAKRGSGSYKNALTMVDLSPNSSAGLFAAAQILPADAKLSVLYCVEPPNYPTFGDLWPAPPVDFTPQREAALQQGTIDLKTFIAAHVAGKRNVEQQVEIGLVVERALRFLETHDCDLVAVGTRGRSAFAAIMLGSIAEGMLDLAPCDVLVAPPPGKVFQPS